MAVGDVNGDGKADVVTSPAAGAGPNVKVFSGANNSTLASFFAYEPTFTGGVFVAAADVTGDGKADIVTGNDAGASANVKVFDGVTLATVRNFIAFDASFTGGVRVAAGDVTGADLFAASGSGGVTLVRGFNGVDGVSLASFLPYGAGYTSGAFVAYAVPEPATMTAFAAAGIMAVRRRTR